MFGAVATLVCLILAEPLFAKMIAEVRFPFYFFFFFSISRLQLAQASAVVNFPFQLSDISASS